jgi:hypothetical protein
MKPATVLVFKNVGQGTQSLCFEVALYITLKAYTTFGSSNQQRNKKRLSEFSISGTNLWSQQCAGFGSKKLLKRDRTMNYVTKKSLQGYYQLGSLQLKEKLLSRSQKEALIGDSI